MRTITAPRPAAAAVPCTALEHATPADPQPPRQRPPARVFLVTTAKSGPGTRTSTIANARNAPYAAHITLPIYALPVISGSRIKPRSHEHQLITPVSLSTISAVSCEPEYVIDQVATGEF